MPKYVLSYDTLSKEKLEKEENKKITCIEINSEDFKTKLIKLLCGHESITTIDWVNNTTITFESTLNVMDKICDEIKSWNYCLDYHLSRIYERKDSKTGKNIHVHCKEIHQQKSVSNFKELVKENCERMK